VGSLNAEVGNRYGCHLAAGVIDKPLPAAAHLSRRTRPCPNALGRVLVLANDMPQARPPR